MAERLELLGAPGSPYTRKMLALLRYRHIPHNVIWTAVGQPLAGYPKPKVQLLPTFYFQDTDGNKEAAVDSTPIIRRLEDMYRPRSVIPDDEALRFIDLLVEDFADEWLTKAMFHYRWAYQADADNAGPLLVYWGMPQMPAQETQKLADNFSQRQIDRLYVVGSNAVTAQTIEESYVRLLGILDRRIAASGFVLGGRPGSADFALYGQLTQLGIIEPTSAALTVKHAPRLRAWIDRVDDLSGYDEQPWLAGNELGQLEELLQEIGRVYAPFLIANGTALAKGQDVFETEIDGRPWQQPVFPYQAKCLMSLRAAYASLSDDARKSVDGALANTGCETLFVAEN